MIWISIVIEVIFLGLIAMGIDNASSDIDA
jgi:hypothetical protein